MLTLYNSTPSGNCYKVRLILAHLGRPYETIEVDTASRDPRPAGLARGNPLNKVPLLVLEDGRTLPESNAILWHLAQGTRYLPADPALVTDVLRWMFFEQNILESSVAVNRFLISYLGQAERFAEPIRFNHRRGEQALSAMEQHLQEHDFFVGGRYSIADIALYAYTHVAEEGRFDLAPRPAIRAWLARVRGEPGHVPMKG
jgi:glutathione S-transferase